MKTIVQTPLGSAGSASVAVGVKGDNIRLEAAVAVEKPISEVVNPLAEKVDGFIDQIEQWIPGDQKAMAIAFKAEFRTAAVDALKKLGETPANG